MEMVMSNGFAELSVDEMNEVDGGVNWLMIRCSIRCLWRCQCVRR